MSPLARALAIILSLSLSLIYIYMYVCMYVCMYIYIHKYIHACMHTYIHIIFMHTHMPQMQEADETSKYEAAFDSFDTQRAGFLSPAQVGRVLADLG